MRLIMAAQHREAKKMKPMPMMKLVAAMSGTAALAGEHNPHKHPADHTGKSDMHPNMTHHKKLHVPAGNKTQVPSVRISLHRDRHAKGACNLHNKVRNFVFKPAEINKTSHWNEGHGHLFTDGGKIARVYGPWHFIARLPAAKSRVKSH